MTGHCEDCGNTLCLCPFDGVQAADVAFALLPPDLLARLRTAVAQAVAIDETRRRSSKGTLPDTAFSSIEWTVADTRALHAALEGQTSE